ncbi:hypothetical protein GGQ84_000486 [Desulfitispora alkaliphila]|uniref:hypothetical protein n=1 Tax=Desulfitispora alkaliphila TaxID=622674 RepID=UPI003D1EBF60
MAIESMDLGNQEKVDYIIQGIDEGKDREQLAKDLGYKNYKSMDMFVRRQGYSWDRHLKKYFLPEEREFQNPSPQGKVREVIHCFDRLGPDPKRVSKEVGFKDHRELALYMKSKGYYWDDDLGNYKCNGEVAEEEVGSISEDDFNQPVVKLAETKQNASFTEYEELLSYLWEHQEELKNLIVSSREKQEIGQVPRYTLSGHPITKSIYMQSSLAQMITDFSKEKNIKQNDLVATALIEFFKKYGYKQEVEILLKK